MTRPKWKLRYYPEESQVWRAVQWEGNTQTQNWHHNIPGHDVLVLDLMTDLNIIWADVDFSLLAPSCALIDNHPLLRPLELVGESNGDNLNIDKLWQSSS